MIEFEKKEKYDIEDLIKIIRLLRSENGCPWDREQTHKSLETNLLEEAYEVIEAIEDENIDLLKEELGDVLLQIVFHTQIENEKENFDFLEITDGICKKLIVRHPHVFSVEKISKTEEVLENWEKIKIKTKDQSKSQAIKNITKTLPSLLKSKKIQQKSMRLGLTYIEFRDIMREVDLKYNTLLDSLKKKDCDNYDIALGELFFYLSGLSIFLEVDPELATKKACDKHLEKLQNKEVQ